MDFLKDYDFPQSLRVKDPAEVNRKLSKIKEDTLGSLQVITDFDYTFSKYHDGNGKRLVSSWGILEKSPVFPDSFREKCLALFNKYHPYEVDPSLTVEEKTPFIAEWYTKLIELITVYITDAELVKKALDGSARVELRDGVSDFVSRLYESHIPLLIFSAGFGELIKNLMTSRGLMDSSLTRIHSNFLEFDPSSGKVLGIKEPVVHVFNKNGGSYLETLSPAGRESLTSRKNVFLLGDSLGDLSMSKGIFEESTESSTTVLKIGFLNHDIEAYMESYTSQYDIVVLDDQTMNLPLHILKLIETK
uniref:5'-nucleotidase n=1 Tax=Caligus rogercresseyi TaxID=217165 RepID=C1BP65_CALRO|nr:Cytosolic 5-nucleotidase III-like protein A [Caligus rogercresseyi]|eukprot:TRINITY_DN3373_c0_g1_i1.p1 TRINITY_DN3373_c0_g1~~TRINITY_DN3373_c0_g1_i1.p1  ORF type:complete len:304 (+),score=79.05 TRINITY_DN3373_c0_g1_i1:194-1105(+)